MSQEPLPLAEETRTDPLTDEELAELVAKLAKEGGHRVAVAESLTAGRVSSMLGRGEQASQWYRGAVVA